jgi:hypothetical protein
MTTDEQKKEFARLFRYAKSALSASEIGELKEKWEGGKIEEAIDFLENVNAKIASDTKKSYSI